MKWNDEDDNGNKNYFFHWYAIVIEQVFILMIIRIISQKKNRNADFTDTIDFRSLHSTGFILICNFINEI